MSSNNQWPPGAWPPPSPNGPGPSQGQPQNQQGYAQGYGAPPKQQAPAGYGPPNTAPHAHGPYAPPSQQQSPYGGSPQYGAPPQAPPPQQQGYGPATNQGFRPGPGGPPQNFGGPTYGPGPQYGGYPAPAVPTVRQSSGFVFAGIALGMLVISAGLGLFAVRAARQSAEIQADARRQTDLAQRRAVEARQRAAEARASAEAQEEQLPDEMVSRKLLPLIRDCVNRYNDPVQRSRARYEMWVDEARGPQATTHNVYGLYSIPGSGAECTAAVAASRALPPAMPDLDAAAQAYDTALHSVLARVSQAYGYYERENYRDDHMALGQQMHPALARAFNDLRAADSALSSILERRQGEATQARLARIAGDESRRAEYLTGQLMFAAREIVNLMDAASISRDRRVRGIDLATFQAKIAAFETAVAALRTFAAGHPQDVARVQNFNGVLNFSTPYDNACIDLMRRVRDDEQVSTFDLDRASHGGAGSVRGLPSNVVEHFNSLVSAHNYVRWPR